MVTISERIYYVDSSWRVLPSTISPSTTNIIEDIIIVKDPFQNMINDAFGFDRNNANEIPLRQI